MNGYQSRILDITGCDPIQLDRVEDIMRNDVVHSTLDWLTPQEFEKAARMAYVVFRELDAA